LKIHIAKRWAGRGLLAGVILGSGSGRAAETGHQQPLGEMVEQGQMTVQGQPLLSPQRMGQDASAASSIAGLPGVDLRSQGGSTAQSDLSIRGSSFSGAGLSLNGVALPNAQTEHFNAELPLHTGMLSAPTVYTGFEQTLAGEGHLTGTVDFSIRPVATERLLSMGLAEKESYWLNLLARQQISSTPAGGTAGIGAFAGINETHALDYDDNDLRASRAGGQAQWRSADGNQWDLLLGLQEKDFGARGYYGVTPLWAARETTEDALVFASFATPQVADENRWRISLMVREQADDYTLFWTLPGVFNNAHDLKTYGTSIDGRWLLGQSGTFDWRLNASEQRIRSSALGDHERAQMGVLAMPGILYGDWIIQAGGLLEVYEEQINEFLPQAAITCQLNERLTLKLAYSESARQPSFTELNYESPASLGNAGLENQQAATTELRLEGHPRQSLSWMLGIFQQSARNTVDWIRETEDAPRWVALNIRTVDTAGVEAAIRWQAIGGSRIGVHYTGLTQSNDADVYASRYALDAPEHLLQFSGYWVLGRRIGLEFLQALRQHPGNPLRQRSDTGYDGSLLLHLLAWQAPQIHLTLGIHNLWEDDFEILPGQSTVSPQRVSAGVTMDW
jgi:vitamin B12 transporter